MPWITSCSTRSQAAAAALSPGAIFPGELQVERTSYQEAASGRMPLRCAPGESLIFGANIIYFLEAVSNGPIAESVVSIYYMDATENLQGRPKGRPLTGTLDPLRLVATGPGWTTVAIIMPIRL